jgi:hypothetical protein
VFVAPYLRPVCANSRMTSSAAALSAAAQSAEMVRFFPFAAPVAFASASLRTVFACLSSFRACLPERVAARSIRLTARSNFRVMVQHSPLGAVLGRDRMFFDLEQAVARYQASFVRDAAG